MIVAVVLSHKKPVHAKACNGVPLFYTRCNSSSNRKTFMKRLAYIRRPNSFRGKSLTGSWRICTILAGLTWKHVSSISSLIAILFARRSFTTWSIRLLRKKRLAETIFMTMVKYILKTFIDGNFECTFYAHI